MRKQGIRFQIKDQEKSAETNTNEMKIYDQLTENSNKS